ncbi:MAG: glycine cleavage system aminomethyltransferase GcvT [Bacteroidales bacterium]|jgi:aminomethyltransferase|nr:glycine cleavage system aminomethyltransferase GcvT [Bacteroidales bacterium]
MKQTVFNAQHRALGAKMEPFAGYEMPVIYEGIIAEHNNVRSNVGVFDVSHMGEFTVKGINAAAFLQRITTNDIASLHDGKVLYTCLPNGNGGVVDDMLVYRIAADNYLVVPNAANIEKDWNWFVRQNEVFNAELKNISDEISQLAIQGPNALKVAQKLTDTHILDMEYYTFKHLTFAGIPDIILSTTGYTGAGGCEIYFKNENGAHIWNAVFEAGAEYGIRPAGLGARDTLRLEMGFCLYGHELNDNTSTIEAGLNFITKFVDGNDFIDRPLYEQQKAHGVSKKLIGFEMADRGIPRAEYSVTDANGNITGSVCSGSQSPSTGKAIGTAYVKPEYAKAGTEIYIDVRGRLLRALVVRMPFYAAP